MIFQKINIILLTTILLTLNAVSQTNLYNKWYFFSRNRVIELSITADSIINRQLDWDMSPRINSRNYYSASSSQYMAFANNKYYFKITGNEDSKKGTVLASIKLNPDGKNILLLDTKPFPSRKAAIDSLIREDTASNFGLPFISEEELIRLRNLPPIDSMDTAGFIRYFEMVIEGRKLTDSLWALPDSPGNILYFTYHQFRILIGQAGYNPFVTVEQYIRMQERFASVPETKERASQLIRD